MKLPQVFYDNYKQFKYIPDLFKRLRRNFDSYYFNTRSSNSIVAAFNWNTSPEGANFWSHIWRLANNSCLSPRNYVDVLIEHNIKPIKIYTAKDLAARAVCVPYYKEHENKIKVLLAVAFPDDDDACMNSRYIGETGCLALDPDNSGEWDSFDDGVTDIPMQHVDHFDIPFSLYDWIDGKVTMDFDGSEKEIPLRDRLLKTCFPRGSNVKAPFSFSTFKASINKGHWTHIHGNNKPVQMFSQFILPVTTNGWKKIDLYALRNCAIKSTVPTFTEEGSIYVSVPMGSTKDWVKDTFLEGKANDPVNHPSHYTSGKIEVIDFLEEHDFGFHIANAVKYICRAGKKNPDTFKQDIEKAIWYIERRITRFERDKKYFTGKSYSPEKVDEFINDQNLPYSLGLALFHLAHANSQHTIHAVDNLYQAADILQKRIK